MRYGRFVNGLFEYCNGNKIVLEDKTVYFPSETLLKEKGIYSVREVEGTGSDGFDGDTIIHYVGNYKSKIISLIRERYSIDDEVAILRQRDTKADEFKKYNAYCEECKAKAKELYNEPVS